MAEQDEKDYWDEIQPEAEEARSSYYHHLSAMRLSCDRT